MSFGDIFEKSVWPLYWDEWRNGATMKSHSDFLVTNIWRHHFWALLCIKSSIFFDIFMSHGDLSQSNYHGDFPMESLNVSHMKVTKWHLWRQGKVIVSVFLGYYLFATPAAYITIFWVHTINFCFRKLEFCVCLLIFGFQCIKYF